MKARIVRNLSTMLKKDTTVEVFAKVFDKELNRVFYLLPRSGQNCPYFRKSDTIYYEKPDLKRTPSGRFVGAEWVAETDVEELPETNRAAVSYLTNSPY